MPYLKTSYNNSSQKNFYKSSGQFLLRNPAISPRHTPKYDIEGIRTLEELEIREIKKALDMYKNYKKDKELAAKALGISRATLYRKLEKYKDEINDYFN